MLTRQQIRAQAQTMYQRGRESAAKAPSFPMPLGGRMGGMSGMADRDESVHGQQYKYARQGWPFASIRPIATRIAAQTIRGVRPSSVAGERAMEGWQKDKLPAWMKQSAYAAMEPVQNHRLLNCINRPNDLMVEWMLMWCTAFSLEATGKCYWWFSEKGGRVMVWPVPTHWVKPNENRTGWAVTPEGALESVPVSAEDMAVFYFPDPSNPLGCMSPLQASARPILSDDAIHESQLQGFRGGHLPTMVAIAGERIDSDGIKRRPEFTEDQRLELESRLMRLHGGPKNHGRIGLVDGLISDFKRLSMAPTEMDYMASMRMTKSEIQNMFGVSPVTMGELENANRASAYVADENFLCNVINPLLEMMGQVLTAFAERSRFFTEPIIAYYEPIIARDPELEQKDWQFFYERGVISDDDVRIHRLGLAPKKNGGDHARISFQLVPVKVDAVPEASPLQQPAEPAKSIKAVTGPAWARIRAQQETVLASAVESVFNKQTEQIVAEVAKGVTSASVLLSSFPVLESLRTSLAEKLRLSAFHGAGIEQAMLKSHAPTNRKAGIEDALYGLGDRIPPYIDQYLKELLNQPYWQDVANGIEPELDRLLREYESQGMDSRSMADALRDELDAMSLHRAQRIARTESNGMLNCGAYATRMELASDGLVTGHRWNVILDKETRGADPSDRFDHVDMDDQVVGINQMFNVDGEMAPFPGHYSLSAANRIGCRCFTTAVTIFD